MSLWAELGAGGRARRASEASSRARWSGWARPPCPHDDGTRAYAAPARHFQRGWG